MVILARTSETALTNYWQCLITIVKCLCKKPIPYFKFQQNLFGSFERSSTCLKRWHCICCTTCTQRNLYLTKQPKTVTLSAPENHTSRRSITRLLHFVIDLDEKLRMHFSSFRQNVEKQKFLPTPPPFIFQVLWRNEAVITNLESYDAYLIALFT